MTPPTSSATHPEPAVAPTLADGQRSAAAPSGLFRPNQRSHAAGRLLAAAGLAGTGVSLPYWADPYTTATAARILALALLAVSVSVLTGHAGLPTLGQTAPFAVGAYTTAILAGHHHPLGTVGVVQVAAAAAAAAGCSALTGLLLVHTRGTVYLMVSVAIGNLAVTAADQWTSVTGGTNGLNFLPPVRPLPGLGELGTDRATYWYCLATAGLCLTVVWLVLRGPAGMLLRGVRDHEPRMQASGHPTARYLYTAHVGAGALAGVGGALLVTVQHAITPGDAGFDTAAIALLAGAVGGRSITGTLAGLAAIIAARDVAGGPFAGHTPALVGGLYLLCVYLLPDGALTAASSIPGRVRARLARHRTRPDAAAARTEAKP
ncbi:branched-chain amino acid ABC transporter permease [Dactylosporangium sp. CA-233914]|uniref:branched-chain amino acid ABC transporter permease n=1 Tax=Dactylosporangium sp. CA-233914 TaxID=3239934 RepID=UPI003D93C05B